MKLFKCQSCSQLLHFENHTCERCGHALGYLPEARTLSALEPDGASWHVLAAQRRSFRFCTNAEHSTCNWLVPAESGETFCRACRQKSHATDADQSFQHILEAFANAISTPDAFPEESLAVTMSPTSTQDQRGL